MRSMSSTMKKKVASRIQTGENSMSASLWVGRPTTPLTDDNFLEKQTVLYSDNITKTSLAVCHPHLGKSATEIYCAYIDSGVIKITKADYMDLMEQHTWEPVEFSQWAEDVSICFDGTMLKAPSGWVELKTEEDPWVFWVLNGKLYANKMSNQQEPIVLAESNCTAVSSVRSMISYAGSFDFGLVVFFLLGGKPYYRQFIDGEWMDAEAISYGPDLSWQDLAAFRTWDYRIGLQLKATNGELHEIFTQYMGIAKQNTEHLEIREVKANSDLIKVDYVDTNSNEHLEITSITAGAPYQGLYSTLSPSIIRAQNLEDENGDWGKLVLVDFDIHLEFSSVESNSSSFSLVDSLGVVYSASSVTLDRTNAKQVLLQFPDFNAANGECRIIYTPGTAQSLAGTKLSKTEWVFTPQSLNPPQIPAPEPLSVWNLDTDGTRIAIKFTEDLIGDIPGNESAFNVSIQEYDKIPGGTLMDSSRGVIKTTGYTGAELLLDLSLGKGTGITSSKNKLSLEVKKNE